MTTKKTVRTNQDTAPLSTPIEGHVNVNSTAAPTADHALEVAGITGFFLLPRMTTVEKGNLTAVNGAMVYDTDLNKVQVYESGAWASVT